MASVIETDQTTEITPSPPRADDSLWPFALLVNDDTVYADSLTELVNYLIPGYAEFATDSTGDVLAFHARVDTASSIVGQAQALILADVVDSGQFALEEQDETVLTALLTPRGTGLVNGLDFGSSWTLDVPLILVATDYTPFTPHPKIEGNVRYFDPSDERTFLDSMQEFGFVELFVNAEI